MGLGAVGCISGLASSRSCWGAWNLQWWSSQMLICFAEWKRYVTQKPEYYSLSRMQKPIIMLCPWQLTMVVQETLRLYSPGTFVVREALQDMKIRDLVIPRGVSFWVPIPVLHQDPELWGPDAHQFNPERFSHGTAGACKNPQAYMPFGVGPRVCVGQHLAMIELKLISEWILQIASFSQVWIRPLGPNQCL